jgi:hypothetical protein
MVTAGLWPMIVTELWNGFTRITLSGHLMLTGSTDINPGKQPRELVIKYLN